MELKVLDCNKFTLNERINEFSKDNKIKNITYLFKAPNNIISIIEYTPTKAYMERIAKEEEDSKRELKSKEVMSQW